MNAVERLGTPLTPLACPEVLFVFQLHNPLYHMNTPVHTFRFSPVQIGHNFMVANYGANGGAVDNDDGSSRYRNHDNFWVYGEFPGCIGAIGAVVGARGFEWLQVGKVLPAPSSSTLLTLHEPYLTLPIADVIVVHPQAATSLTSTATRRSPTTTSAPTPTCTAHGERSDSDGIGLALLCGVAAVHPMAAVADDLLPVYRIDNLRPQAYTASTPTCVRLSPSLLRSQLRHGPEPAAARLRPLRCALERGWVRFLLLR